MPAALFGDVAISLQNCLQALVFGNPRRKLVREVFDLVLLDGVKSDTGDVAIFLGRGPIRIDLTWIDAAEAEL